ncbi:MAG: phospholipase [Alicyclobacillus macrosporangiidus]|uniref:alkaline phosphatase family protein n=1 Tax=Alicyclobacillus macrosporangiidus TaxID=392015 RepID=UPI0026F2C436|nr:alkaline phosphatase family protein [Alicyclobacillus macrosporangiidus]MCL6597421.1 phospholipase [Alicyclobacillus macrosporangiidus]
MKRRVKLSVAATATAILSSGSIALASHQAAVPPNGLHPDTTVRAPETQTPIQHVVVIFQENVSFDHYFGTYPYAKNPPGEPKFFASPGTPNVNGLTGPLLTHNPNGVNPQRLDRSQSITDDMDHDYTAEQKAYDGGLVDKFKENTAGTDWPFPNQDPNIVMDYYDGNTVTALWNYAQHFAMNDNSYSTTFGPSTPGALNLISGQTHGAVAYSAPQASGGKPLSPDAKGVIIQGKLNSNNTLYGDQDPYYDNASKATSPTVAMTGKNIGDLLNEKGVTWGWFEGGFRDPSVKHQATGDGSQQGPATPDYSPHHEPFQYYASTANPNHTPPASVSEIGHDGPANHQYDLMDFWAAVNTGHMPAVSFLKAPAYQDGHAGYSGPLDEQRFLVDTLNKLQKTPEWKSTAVIIAYDDSDGWYDHVMPPIVNGSNDPAADALLGPGQAGTPSLGSYLDRLGYGPRQPLLVISPWAKRNFVDHTLTDQTSILRFIEDNWNLGRIGDFSYDAIAGSLLNMFDFTHGPSNSQLFLDPNTGEPVSPTSAPFVKGGHPYMALSHLAEVLNTDLYQNKGEGWFTYDGHRVIVPFHGRTVTVDGRTLDLGAGMTSVKGALFLPVDKLAAALGVKADGLLQGYAEPAGQ